jgi:hypothetical protein
MNMIVAIFKCKECAEWMVAFGTILLAIVTFIIHMIGDSSTRLMKEKINYDFQKRAYAFLFQTFSSGRSKDKIISSNPKITTEENIEEFYKDIIDSKIYLTWCNERKLKQYVSIARKLAEAWDSYPNNAVEKYQRLTLTKMEKLSTSIGKEKDIRELRFKYPYHFKKQ